MSSWLSFALHAQTILQVKNQHNKPLENAVLEITTKDGVSAWQVKDSPFIMDQVNKRFSPEVLIVPKDSSVSFPNSDDIRHHVYSFSPAKPFELKLYAGKSKAPVSFQQQGLVVLGCNIHDAMVGYIYVTENKNTFMSGEHGEVEIDIPVEQITNITVWHANAQQGVNHRKSFQTFDVKKQQITLTINTIKPPKRDSFEDVFGYAH
ncbi:methylamine utilization protein [Thalassotalea sp. 1_MG-2023]|uniref:methylamine utilization protein n=1 Tax=Thalassotalea sp. 1_MG-2023 TaxID=3062680 RepID=UPI0026E2D3C7|nr:methylamine utilization protein [Thalassotalea sp. 1_MG-2023]MDO6425892.1 methylamine utilization protein [Thalassotalea sp. 1_MG-2023]